MRLAALGIVVMAGLAAAEPLPMEATHEDLGVDPVYGRGPSQARDQRLLGECQELARKLKLSLYSYHFRLVGNRVALFASCSPTADAGLVLVGTIGSERPKKGEKPVAALVVRLDAARRVLWKKELRKKTYRSIEGQSAVEAPNGDLLIGTQLYHDPASFSSPWVLRLTAKGKPIWECVFPGRGKPGSPLADTYRLLSDSRVFVEGHIYPTQADLDREATFAWTGVIDTRGKLVDAKIGAENPKPSMR